MAKQVCESEVTSYYILKGLMFVSIMLQENIFNSNYYGKFIKRTLSNINDAAKIKVACFTGVSYTWITNAQNLENFDFKIYVSAHKGPRPAPSFQAKKCKIMVEK
jgi:hypothetical protein